MYIEKIIIECFKSYRGPMKIGPFDSKYNVVVGRNGSGKSNFFEAIRFVLCEDYQKLAAEEYDNYLHKSTSIDAPSAFVEIIFNNFDKQFPLDVATISIRREIGRKKDQYFFNKNKVTKNEILNFFESAGLLKSNPYYIVKQGKLLEIVTATDQMRLKHLEEIAGVTLFKSRYKEMKTLLDSIVNHLMHDELSNKVNKCLKQKEEEEKDVKQYVELDKQRRLFEYFLSELEVKKFTILLTQAQRRHSEQCTDLIKVQQKLKSLEEEISESTNRVEEIKKQIKNNQLDVRELVTAKEKLLINERNWNDNVDNLTESIRKDKVTQEEFQAELQKLMKSIDKYQADLIPMKTKYETTKIREEEITHDLAVKKQLQKELNLKKERKRDFKSRDERDAWIRAQLELLNKDIKNQDASRIEYEIELKAEKDNKRDLEHRIVILKQDLEKQAASIKDYQRELNDRENDKIQYQKQRKDLFEKKNINDNQLKHLNNELKKADHAFGMSKNILDGRDSVAKVLDILRQQPGGDEVDTNYYGLVVENFDAADNVSTAIETAAGPRLLHHIVSTDDFGRKILDEINRNNLSGDATFLPINRLPVRVDKDHVKNKEALSLLLHLNYIQELACVMNHIFGKTFICRNLKTAAEAAKKYKFNCVTLNGEKISVRGDIAGGFRRNFKSVIEAQKTRFKILEEITKTKDDLKNINEKLQSVENEVTENLRMISKLEVKLQKTNDIQRDIKNQINMLEERLRYFESTCAEKDTILNEFVTNLEIRRSTKEALENELEQGFLSQLSGEEQQQLEEVDDEIERLSSEKHKLVKELINLSDEKDRLEKFLKKDLLRKEKLEDNLQELTVAIEKNSAELQLAKSEINEIKKKIKNINKLINNEKITALLEEKDKLTGEIEKLAEKKKEISKEYQTLSNLLDGLQLKVKSYEKTIAEYKKKLTKFGPIQPNDIPQLSSKQLNEKLRDVNLKLKAFGNVNLHVRDQLEKAAEYSEKLTESKRKILEYIDEAREFLKDLEEQEVYAIWFTLQRMNKYFNRIFKKLVPSGSAKLITRTGRNNNKNVEDISVEEIASGRFTGVGIEVSFDETSDEHQTLDQFSGGQKSLVALAFIFAAQKCNPTPFYILDECDYCLDPEYRENLAALIKKLSAKTQFISTTFRPEQLEHADKFFGIQFQNKISYLQEISKDEAVAFVEN